MVRMVPPIHSEVDTMSEADPQRRGTWLSRPWARPLKSGILIGLVTAAVLDLGFGINISGIARSILPLVVVLCLVISILDYCRDD